MGHLVLFLHAHLPYVRHPEHPSFLEEDWLYEAITETYLPLVSMMEGWVRDGVPGRLTMSLTPPLVEMLRDELLTRRYVERITRLLDVADKEVVRTRGDDRFHHTAIMYRDHFADCLDRFDRRYGRDLVGAFARMQDAGVLEIVTCTATHAFLPVFGLDEAWSRAQIRLGVKSYREHFKRNPPGIWLAECGYVPGIDRLLADEGLTYFFVDSHGVRFSDPPPVLGTYAPIVCPSGVLAFPRDDESSKQVWSRDEGYPGDARYREFYRDLGYDAEVLDDDLKLPDGGRKNIGIKYHRVTGRGTPLHDKQPYHRGWAMDAVDSHAGNFVFNRAKQLEHWRGVLGRSPIVVAPYDAELFGHWWYEGPEFIDKVVRKACYDQRVFRLSTPSDVIFGVGEEGASGTNGEGPKFQVATPAASSWGAKGYGEVWLNDSNAWVWPHVHQAAAQMKAIATERRGTPSELERRALNQLARELVLASSSDWPFIMTMGTMVPYAERRVREHINRFNRLLGQLRESRIDEVWLEKIEQKDRIFRHIDFADFAG